MLADSVGLFELSAADLMSREVISVPAQMSLGAAAQLLCRAQVSGAPVVDASGRCIGVLSASDFVRWTKAGHKATSEFSPSRTPVCAWEVLDHDDLPTERVELFMTRDLVLAPPNTSLGTLARMMRDAHIHRVIIVDADKRPLGVVSSLDILAALARFDTQ